MTAQKVLLRVILVALAVAALFGAAGALLIQSTADWEVVASLVLTAICSGALLWTSRRWHEPGHRVSGMAGAVLVAVEFFLGVAVIWDIWPIGTRDQLGQFMLALLGAGVPALVCLRLAARRTSRIAGWFGVAICATVLLFWTLCIMNFTGWDWFEYGNSLAFMGLLATTSLVGLGTDRWHWRWIGFCCAGAALALLISNINQQIVYESWQEPQLLWLIAVAAIASHANIVLRTPTGDGQRWVAYATIAAFAAAAGLTVYDFPQHAQMAAGAIIDRLARATGILAGCGTVALAIITRLNQKSPSAVTKDIGSKEVTVICPMCQRKQTTVNGRLICEGCRLQIAVKLEEPRCAKCGYSLLMLKADRCPECGATIGQQQIDGAVEAV